MKNLIFTLLLTLLLLISCTNKSSLQQYFVSNQDQPNFVSVDVSPSILNLDKAKLSKEETTVLASFEKMNILAYKANPKLKLRYNIEKTKVVDILKDTVNYHQLIKIGSGAQGASISYVGDENHINEFVVFGNKKENGFVIARILGRDMKPENAMLLFSILQKSNIEAKQLEVFKDIMK